MCPPLDAPRDRISSTRSVSPQSSRKSSHTAMSDSCKHFSNSYDAYTYVKKNHMKEILCLFLANSSMRYTEPCKSSRQSASIGPEKTSRMPQSGSKVKTHVHKLPQCVNANLRVYLKPFSVCLCVCRP